MGVTDDGIEPLTPERLATARRLLELHYGRLPEALPEVCGWCLRPWVDGGCPDRRWSEYIIGRAQNERIARALRSGHAHA